MQQIALAMELPFILVFSVVIGGAAGYFVDSWLHTSPAFIILMGVLGFAAGVREVLRRIPKEEQGNDGG